MAEKPTAEKTEQPTPKKLEKAKNKGVVPQSQEFTSTVTLLVLVAMVTLLGPNLLQWFIMQIKCALSGFDNGVFADGNSFGYGNHGNERELQF